MEKYFNDHKRAYAQPERRSIVFVTTKSQSVAEAVAEEHGSGGLTAAAGKHSVTATPTTVPCQQPSAGSTPQAGSVIGAICAAKSGVVSGPVKMTPNYYVFEVKSIIPATQSSFAQNKERIKQQLSSQGQRQGMLKYNEEVRAKLKAQTECAAGYVVPLCKKYVAPKLKAVSKAKR
jgi:PPIC-type PPIASE domain